MILEFAGIYPQSFNGGETCLSYSEKEFSNKNFNIFSWKEFNPFFSTDSLEETFEILEMFTKNKKFINNCYNGFIEDKII